MERPTSTQPSEGWVVRFCFGIGDNLADVTPGEVAERVIEHFAPFRGKPNLMQALVIC
jgi:hypothetical protein